MSDQTAEPQPGKEPNTITVPDAKVTAPTKTVFGLHAISLPTPESANQFFKIFLTFTTIAVLVVNGIPELPTSVKHYVLEGALVALAVVNKVKEMWGLSTEAE